MIDSKNTCANWELGFLARGINAYCSDPHVLIEGGVYTHSGEVQPGGLYVARRGENSDGHAYIHSAKQAGAAAVMVEDPTAAIAHQIPYILVQDSTLALGALAKLHLADLRQKSQGKYPIVVGITGSAGKTTTKDLLYRLLSELGESVAPIKSFNNEVGLPLTVLKATDSTQYLILEMGASAPGELSYLSEIAPLDYAVELMVGSAHLGGYGTVAALAQAKAEMLSGLRDFPETEKYRAELPALVKQALRLNETDVQIPAIGTNRLSKAVLNLDDSYIKSFLKPGPQVLGFSATGTGAHGYELPILVKSQTVTPDQRVIAEVEIAGEITVLELGLTGRHNLSNALAAATVAYDLGLRVSEITRVIREHRAVSPHRMHVFKTKSGTLVIDDSYNANLDSMKAGLEVLRHLGSARTGRKVAVLGAMLELGSESAALHQKLATAVNAAGVAQLFTIGEPIRIIDSVLSKSINHRHYQTIADLEVDLLEFLEENDTLLLKGSNGSGIWQIADNILMEGGTL